MKKTTEDFKIEVSNLTNNEYTLISEYINNKTRVTIQHNKCNNIYEVRPDRFIQGDRCPYCAGKIVTTDEYKNKVYNLTNGEYELISEYINNKTKIKILHHKCNNIFEITPINFNNNHRCPYCSHPSKKNSIEDIKTKIFNQVNNEYTLLSDTYINNKSKLLFRHNKCGNEFESSADNFLNKKRRCPKCSLELRSKKHKLTHEEFLAKIPKDVFNDYDILTKYTARKNNIKVLCKKCNNTFILTADEFLAGNRCPHCRVSIGEDFIDKWLTKNGYEHIWHFKDFKDCKYKKTLEFDFKLEDSNGKIFIIEYDGEFHFLPIYGKKQLELQIKRDNIKNDYCKKHGIDIYRIPYTKFNELNSILESIVSKYNY